MYKNIIKPFFDFFIAFCLLLVASPLFLLVFLGLFWAQNGNVFFTQKRPGKNERIFSILKFKTMTDHKDQEGNLLPDAKRLTKIGKLVRKTSLDELPQLINVLKGEMSIVGPRPLLPEYLSLYNEEQKKRHAVKPGITGWAQVNGRNAISWTRKFEYDVWYVKNLNFILDVSILLKTIKKVFISEGISPEDQPIMPTFTEYMRKKKNHE